jgi:hypothetical protein
MKLAVHSEGHLQAMLGPASKPGGNRAYQSARQARADRYQDLHCDRPSRKEYLASCQPDRTGPCPMTKLAPLQGPSCSV